MIKISNQVKELSDSIWNRSKQEAKFYPIDRFFLEGYLDKIRKVDSQEFILYNLESYSGLYSVQLLICLPEVLGELELSELIEIFKSIKKAQSFFSLILFTYKYIGVDIFSEVLRNIELSDNMRFKVKDFLKRQYQNLVLTEDEEEDFRPDSLGINLSDWIYVRQKFLLDDRVEAASCNLEDLKGIIEKL